jgi:hypothetical protein
MGDPTPNRVPGFRFLLSIRVLMVLVLLVGGASGAVAHH